MPVATPNESKIAVGAVLVGKYRVVREIGRGGMAAVYEAEQLTLGKKVAIKILAAELAQSTIVIERFFREARAAASVKSPHIVDVYDSGRLDDGRPFIAMELLEGESLYDRMARIRLIDPATTVRIITHCAKGLAKAHAAGIVHRDLKPENIFIVKTEEGDEISKILDFGLAKFYSPVNPGDEKSKRLTREGAVFGTPAYMSPEQVKGQGNVDQRADLWALGCMAYECLTGRPVWNMDQGVAMTFAAIATAPFPIPSKMRPDLPPEFDEWFKKALERDPDKRFQSAKDLADALGEVWGARLSSPSVQSDPRATAATELPNDLLESLKPPAPQPSTQSSPRLPPAAASGKLPQAHESQASVPLPLVTPQGTPSTMASEATTSSPGSSPARIVLSALLFAGALTVAGFVWVKQLQPTVFVPLVVSSATAPPSASSAAPPTFDEDEPKWAPVIAEGQKLYESGQKDAAQKKFAEAAAMPNGAAIGKLFQDQTAIASSGPCRLVAFSHPRLQSTVSTGRPSVLATSKGAIVAWTDSNDTQPKRDHVKSVLIDSAGRPLSKPRDITPEAGFVYRPQLVKNEDKVGVLYWDATGKDSVGVRIRKLDEDGRIDGASKLVGGARPPMAQGAHAMFWPSIEKTPTGFYVAWEDDRDKDGPDLFVRKLNKDFDTVTAETRLTDYVTARGRTPKVHAPGIAVASNMLIVPYRLEREATKNIYRMRIPLTAPELEKGLDEPTKDSAKKDREIGDVKLVNEDKIAGDAPAIACGTEGCFIVWHAETGPSQAARIDPVEGKVVWRQKIGDKSSTHPDLGVSADGQVYVAFYEGGRVKMATLSRAGVDKPSVIARVIGEHPRPWITPATAKGEWYVAWEDLEGGRTEPYVARVTCR